MNIDNYIELSKKMNNTSDGGSAAYHFDDVVLVRYTNYNKYGLARENEELISIEANMKRNRGVNTPYHIAYKREVLDKENICWVLQERAKGVCFDNYTTYKNSVIEQLDKQMELLNLPQSIYDKLVSDIYELYNMGIELKPKNIYFDKEYGFTIIDLLNYNSRTVDDNNLKDVMMLKRYVEAVFNSTTIGSYAKGCAPEIVDKSKIISYGIKKKIYLSLQNKINNFDSIKRHILRTYSKEELDYFNIDEDLNYNEEDYIFFNNIINNIINYYLNKIEVGQLSYSEVIINEIRITISQLGLKENFKYHKDYPKLNKEDYEDEWEYNYVLDNYLNNLIYNLFDNKIEELSKVKDNLYITNAYNDLIKRRSRVLR